MFAVDLTHGLLRHTYSHHGRETIAFNRRLNTALERAALFVVWRNLIKGRSERRADPRTPGMAVGVTDRPWTWPMVLSRRLFPSKIRLADRWQAIYRRELITEFVGRNTRHELKYAF